MKLPSEEERRGKHAEKGSTPGPGWGLALVLLAIAMLVAALIAWRMIYPFFHRPARGSPTDGAALYLPAG
ncbi:hypothetical protein [Silvibacterium sp.]|uniref:hypothetical protein n=1 Tax=Silvibacterium sp. TaxID=1964179 RepID=UPI0039E393DC